MKNKHPARLVQSVDGLALVSNFAAENIIIAMEIRGYEFVGYNTNARQREELQGAPKFRGVNGPMWDGDCLRYECPETTRIVTQ